MQPTARRWFDIRRAGWRPLLRAVAVALSALAAATLLAAVLEDRFGVLNAAPVYLLAVVSTALVAGTIGALVAAAGSFLAYDYLFVHPVRTLEISDPGEWLNLLLLLFVGIVVGRLTAVVRSRALTAEAREREARELFHVSRALATRESTAAALPGIAEELRLGAGFTSVWVALGDDDAAERVAAISGDPPPAGTALHWMLRRMPGDEPARWLRIHAGGPRRDAEGAATGADRASMFRVRIEAAGRTLGSIWATRGAGAKPPDRSSTRLISAAADQVGQALVADRHAAEAGAVEVARQSDALKSALLQAVSHDLRAPLATIRAAAGTLRAGSDVDAAGRDASVDAIEREVVRLDRLVSNLLDLGRIEAGALRADLDVFELDDLVERVVDRMAQRLAAFDLQVDLPALPVLVDPVFLDEALTNLLDNAVRFAPPSATIRVVARRDGDRAISLVVEDSGPGVPEDHLGRLFEPFYRVPVERPGTEARSGTGIGLAVVRGLVEAMGGTAAARSSSLGGLALELRLTAAILPADLAVAPG